MCARIYEFLHDFAGAIATIIAATAAVIVTWRLGKSQLRIAEQQATLAKQQAALAGVRLQHDLFDRRFKVYDAAKTLCLEVYMHNNVSRQAYISFVNGTADTIFLYDQIVVEYIEDMRMRALRLQRLVDILTNPTKAEPDEITGAPNERSQLATWFVEQFSILIAKFKPFLALDQRQLPSLTSHL